MKTKLLLLSILTLAAAYPIAIADAATGNVPFTSEIQDTCTIVLNSEGVMAASDLSTMDSRAAGGRAGRVQVSATGQGFRLSTSAPTTFTESPGGVGNVRFSSLYSSTGATSVTNVDGTQQTDLGLGVSNVSVDLEAVATDAIFPSGRYRADVTVTCE